MFKNNPDAIVPDTTPERVLSICRLVSQKKMTRNELRSIMTLNKMGTTVVGQIDKSITVALEELNIIRSKDNYFELAVSTDLIDSSDSFRRYVASTVFNRPNSTFFMFSRWVISQNEKLFSMDKWEVMAKTCASEISELSALSENAVLGWRFWAMFLGLGYLNKTMFIPNMKVRLQDIFVTSFEQKYKYGEAVRATDFINWLSSKLPEADLKNQLPLAVSSGLRTLNELGLIKLEAWRDSNRIKLFFVDGDPINEFSHITVSEEVCK